MSATHELTLTKIVATLGPASSSPDIIEQLITEGVRVFRINFSHGEFSEHLTSLQRVRAASTKLNQHIGVLGDLCGPKIRVGKQDGAGTQLGEGGRVAFIPEFVDADLASRELNGLT
ncbi:MAG TPA: pyruvate kinase, partial [Verrucomicrobiae bacterium]|nr:pyruvate kinase [Verrucomicrobiae bacterium]